MMQNELSEVSDNGRTFSKEVKIQRIAAYCRVSTDKDDQVNSLESQKKYFSEYIDRNQYWELFLIYSDEGVTGTSTKRRMAFNQMIADAQNHRFDLIITKEISRFARNTLDSIFYTRKLKELGIGVIFMNDNINTLDPDAELRLTIMSSIAQEESRKTSDRVKWGQKRRMEQGVVFGRDMLGYDVRGGKLYINEEGAKIVRLIFHKFVAEGKGTHVIARELREEGIKTATYMKQWSNTVILRIIRNEKYCGDLIQKKTYTPNYLNHDKKYNRGQEEFVVIRDHHEPIVSRELFNQAQRELERRSPSAEQKAKYSNRYCFSGKIKCGLCGCSFVSRTKKRSNSTVYKAWRCFEATKHGSKRITSHGDEIGCNCPSLNEDDTKLIMQQVVKNMQMDKQALIDNLSQIVIAVVRMDEQGDTPKKTDYKMAQILDKKQALVELYLEKEISKPEFLRLSGKYEEELKNLEQQRLKLSKQNQLQTEKAQMLQDIIDKINNLANGETWDDTFYRNILDKIVVYDKNRIDVYLNLIPHKWSYVIFDAQEEKK